MLEQISQLFNNLYGYEFNRGTVLEARERGYSLAEPIETQIKEHRLTAKVVHFDEKGIRSGGKLHWLHTASNQDYTYYQQPENQSVTVFDR